MAECALNAAPNGDNSCLTEEHIDILIDFDPNVKTIIKKCQDDACVLDTVVAPEDVKGRVKREALKIPTAEISHNHWLSNTEVDSVMSQFRLKYNGFGHGFIHMCDLKSFEPSNLSTFNYPVYQSDEIDFGKEFRYSLTQLKKINKPLSGFTPKVSTHGSVPLTSYGIICNTDSSKGRGQHWFCIYISTDQKDPDDTSKPWIRIELFNSAGGGCDTAEFNKFWRGVALDISKETGLKCTYDAITNIQHQGNDTGNCGSYSLFYIYSRLNGCLPSEFDNPQYKITDDAMLKFRSVCFAVDEESKAFKV